MLHETILWMSLQREEKLWKYAKTVNLYKLERGLQYCLRNPQIVCKAEHAAKPPGEIKLKFLHYCFVEKLEKCRIRRKILSRKCVKVASFLPQKICETGNRVKIRETAHTQGSVVFHGPRRDPPTHKPWKYMNKKKWSNLNRKYNVILYTLV